MRSRLLKHKIRSYRLASVLLVLAVIIVSTAGKFGWGSVCAFGADGLAYICPLGFLQTSLATRHVSPTVWLPLGLVLLSIVLFGRYFCGWLCPTIVVKALAGRELPSYERAKWQPRPLNKRLAGIDDEATPSPATPWSRWLHVLDGRHLVLASALVASFVFRFPVFCLICPVGIFFGAVLAVGRLFTLQQPSLELVLFPALLTVEIVAMRSWCQSICPLGGLLSLLSSLNPFFRPVVSKERCLHASRVNCQVCRRLCPEGIDLHSPSQGRSVFNCTRCLVCADHCPAQAVDLKLLPPRESGNAQQDKAAHAQAEVP